MCVDLSLSSFSVIGSRLKIHVYPVSHLLIKCHGINVPLFCLVDWEKMRETGLYSVLLAIVQENESLLAWCSCSYRIFAFDLFSSEFKDVIAEEKVSAFT